MDVNFYNPVKILSGAGCLREYTGFAEFGRRCMIVCGATSARRCGALADAEAALAACGVEYTVFDRIEQNPLAETCHAAGAAAREWSAEFILGIGGGSPLDAAKACAVFARNPELGPEDVYRDPAKLAALPVLCVPTTAGTGSEVTPYSIMTLRSAETKKSFTGENMWPRVAFLDAAYTASLPAYFTVSTAVDALSHAIEGYFSLKASLVSDSLAERACELILPVLRCMAADEEQELTIAEREALLCGSTLAGMVISRTGTGFPHACGYKLTYFHGLPHGHANACFLADFLAFAAEAEPERAARLCAAGGIRDAVELAEILAAVLPEAPAITEEEAARYAAESAAAKNCRQSRRPVGETELLPIFRRLCR